MITKVQESNLFLDFDKLMKKICDVDSFIKKELSDKSMDRNIYAIYDIQNDDILLRERKPYDSVDMFLIGDFYKNSKVTQTDQLISISIFGNGLKFSHDLLIKKVEKRLKDQVLKFQKQLYEAITEEDHNEFQKLVRSKDSALNSISSFKFIPQSFIEKDIDTLFNGLNDINYNFWNLKSSFLNLEIHSDNIFLMANEKNKISIFNKTIKFLSHHQLSREQNGYREIKRLINFIIDMNYDKRYHYYLSNKNFSDLYLLVSQNESLFADLNINPKMKKNADKDAILAINEKLVKYIDNLDDFRYESYTKNLLIIYNDFLKLFTLELFKENNISIIHPNNHKKIIGRTHSNILLPRHLDILKSSNINIIDLEINDDDDLKYFYGFIQMMYSKSFETNSDTSLYLDFKYILDKKYKSQLLEISNHLDHMLGTIVTNNFAKAMLGHITWK